MFRKIEKNHRRDVKECESEEDKTECAGIEEGRERERVNKR
jgi:hypothetical protein